MRKKLWEEAISTAAYFLDRYPRKKLENVTPEEAWLVFKPNLNHLKVFGSIAYRHVPGQLIKKLDNTGEVMILVGYHSTNGYKVFDVVSRRIVISRDVVIDKLKQLQQGVTSYQQSITGYMQAVTDYQNPVTGYKFEIPDSEVARRIEQHVIEARN